MDEHTGNPYEGKEIWRAAARESFDVTVSGGHSGRRTPGWRKPRESASGPQPWA